MESDENGLLQIFRENKLIPNQTEYTGSYENVVELNGLAPLVSIKKKEKSKFNDEDNRDHMVMS